MKKILKTRINKIILAVTFFASSIYLALPYVAYADVNSSKAQLKKQGKTIIDNFADVAKYLAIPAAILSLIVIFIAGSIVPDEDTERKTKRHAKWVLIIAALVGCVSWIISIASNK
ncbi:TPA_asm: hypothetical protein GIO55_14320 [Listeria monocytogenes]|nr:hypothetical protein [Listeria monocytogenes]